ncbi:dihydrodipicolinate synthase family protein [Rhizobium sp. RM]|uniref:dihydrodipicolinate synthase family protein n=1 Tax=Rhizobium sp. RM TaxID=2748079 RepID=UPI00110F6587|nr:dihydrodipicolinate synthase family protein [Rhizobium sp. RM]NWJ27676.1 dihydrodipicolinate synthase family protein [Rhizobium sp. RM]TMV21842.1 dihydrodipicolinate synthase family protein [Rhizobium sp. Td3]
MKSTDIYGVIAAVPTPLNVNGEIDLDAFVEHCTFCLSNGCDFLNVLGTTGEANGFSADERVTLMQQAASRLDPNKLMVGTGTPDIETTVRLTTLAHSLGYAAALVLPPFYYKPVEEDGLFAYFEQVVTRTAASPIAIYLYNFPQLTGIEFSPALAKRLIEAFPDRIKGAKDSSGNLAYARQLAHIDNFAVFPSNEASLADAARDNFAGCISATVNIDPAASQHLWNHQEDAAALAHVTRLRSAITAHPLISAVKYLVGLRSGNERWNRVLAPNLAITDKHRQTQLKDVAPVSVAAA